MSLAAVARVLSLPRKQVSPLERLVLIALAYHSGPSGCFPSEETIAGDCGTFASTVRNVLHRLERAGLIVVTVPAGRHRPKTYRLAGQLVETAEQPGALAAESRPPSGPAPSAQETAELGDLDRRAGRLRPPGCPAPIGIDSTDHVHVQSARGDRPSTSPAVGGRGRRAYTGRPPVPASLHQEFLLKLGPEQTEADLVGWYREVEDDWRGRAIEEDDFSFWRTRRAEYWASRKTVDDPIFLHLPATWMCEQCGEKHTRQNVYAPKVCPREEQTGTEGRINGRQMHVGAPSSDASGALYDRFRLAAARLGRGTLPLTPRRAEAASAIDVVSRFPNVADQDRLIDRYLTSTHIPIRQVPATVGQLAKWCSWLEQQLAVPAIESDAEFEATLTAMKGPFGVTR